MTEHDQPQSGGDPHQPSHEPATPSTRSSGKNFRRILGLLVIGIIVFVALLPTIVSALWLGSSLTPQLSKSLGTDVEIESVSVGWFSGLELRGLRVANQPGFPRDEPAIAIDELRGDISFLSLFGGKLDISGHVDGLRVHVIQREDGTNNLVTVDSSSTSDPKGTDRSQGDDQVELGNLRLDLTTRNSDIKITQQPIGVVEHFRNVETAVKKPFGTNDFVVSFGADIGAESDPGRIDVAIDFDAAFTRPARATLDTKGVDLARYRPILDAKLPQQLEEFAGVAEGRIEATVDPAAEVIVGGLLTVVEPRIAGPLVGDMKIRAPSWTFEPKITADLRSDPPTIDTSGLQVNLGFVQLAGIDAATTQNLLGQSGFGAEFSIDLAKVAEFGGEPPPDLAGDKIKMSGRVALPPPGESGFDVDALLASLIVDSSLEVGRLTYAGRGFKNLVIDADSKGGAVSISTRDGGTVDGGALKFGLQADLTKLDTEPMKATLQIDGAQLTPADAPALRFVIPFLAGLVPDAPHVDLGGKLNVALDLGGPVMPREGQAVLEWLNEFGGTGSVSLTEGAFTPAAALGQFLQLAGQQTKLSFSTIATDFSLSAGKISSDALNLTTKGQSFEVKGSTTLAGALDYAIDISSAIAAHKDGQKVLQYIPKDQLVAHIRGDVDSPSFAAPDIGQLIQTALKNTLQNEAKKAVEEKAGDLLRDLLRRR